MLFGKPSWYEEQIDEYQCMICGFDKPDAEYFDDVSNMAQQTACFNAITTCGNDLINISTTVNGNNPFGDYWISERHLFTTICDKWIAKIRRLINDLKRELMTQLKPTEDMTLDRKLYI
ncbi:hypothetical protein H5410_059908 [Solanum commersonii]|uniref:Uncharacterized protein n=1 Tax=Solanum commersonii TaxID=4109 RepID=A0A9J5W4X4_SOLCO|nr:hypothetical protein H5410_059908 [Solanum commersonii]